MDGFTRPILRRPRDPLPRPPALAQLGLLVLLMDAMLLLALVNRAWRPQAP